MFSLFGNTEIKSHLHIYNIYVYMFVLCLLSKYICILAHSHCRAMNIYSIYIYMYILYLSVAILYISIYIGMACKNMLLY